MESKEKGNLTNEEEVLVEQASPDAINLKSGREFDAPKQPNLVPLGYNADKLVNPNNPPDQGDMPFDSTDEEIEAHVDGPSFAPHFNDNLPFNDTPADRGRREQELIDADAEAQAEADAKAEAKAEAKAAKKAAK